jgi:hypothetical protein
MLHTAYRPRTVIIYVTGVCWRETEFTLARNVLHAFLRQTRPALSRHCELIPSISVPAFPCLRLQLSSLRSLSDFFSSLSSKDTDTDHAQNLFSMAHSYAFGARLWPSISEAEGCSSASEPRRITHVVA